MTTTPNTCAHTQSRCQGAALRGPSFILTDTIKLLSRFSTPPRHQHTTAALLSYHPARKPGCKWGWSVIVCGSAQVFVFKWWGSGACIDPTPIAIKKRRRMEMEKEEEVASQIRYSKKGKNVLHIPEASCCFCLTSAERGHARELNSCEHQADFGQL